MRPPIVAVCGPSSPSEEEAALAFQVGRQLARHGAVVICGGLGGAMAAAASGAAANGGTCIGLLPGDDPHDASEHVTIALATGLGEMRNALLVRCAQAVIAIGGGLGTATEVALALRLRRPTVGLGTWGLVPPKGQPQPELHQAASAEEAVDLALSLISGSEHQRA